MFHWALKVSTGQGYDFPVPVFVSQDPVSPEDHFCTLFLDLVDPEDGDTHRV